LSIAILGVEYELSVPDVFVTTQMSLFFLRHSPLIDAFNTIAAERLSIAMSANENKPSMSQKCFAHLFPELVDPQAVFEPLNFEAVSGAFGVWAMMLAMSVGGFAAELIYANVSQKTIKSNGKTRTKKGQGTKRLILIEYTENTDARLDAFFEMMDELKGLEVIRILD
jgi:hypothetical protein